MSSPERGSIDPRLASIHQRALRNHQLRELLGTKQSEYDRLSAALFGSSTRAIRSEILANEHSRERLGQNVVRVSDWVLNHGVVDCLNLQDDPENQIWQARFDSVAFETATHALKEAEGVKPSGPFKLALSPKLVRAELMYYQTWNGDFKLEIFFRDDNVEERSFGYDSDERPLEEITDEECSLVLSFTDQFIAEQKI